MVMDQESIHILLVSVVVAIVASTAIGAYYYKSILGYGASGREPYSNGVSVLFGIQLVFGGPGFQTFMKLTSKSTRRRLYSGFRRMLVAGHEIWTAGHPALVKHVFKPQNAKLFYKADKKTLNAMFFQPDAANNAMLYTGDDDGWRHARITWSPFFLQKDFTVYDEKIDEVVSKHLKRLLEAHDTRIELLELMLFVTVDLLCQVLYGAELPDDELIILVEALAEFTVPATTYRGKYPGSLDCHAYHSKVAKAISDAAPDGVFVKIILKDNDMSDSLKYENCAFFLEALTPAFASFWTCCNVMLRSSTQKDIKEDCINDPVFREKCIKESLRMYPPVPALWPRIAARTHTMENPLYDSTVEDERSLLEKLLLSEADIRTKREITIKEGTAIFVVPSCIHYDDRVWMNPEEFLPQRWDKDPKVVNDNTTTDRKARKTMWGGLNVGKDEDFQSTLSGLMKKERATIGTSIYNESSESIRYKLFGAPVESGCESENLEFLKAAAGCEDFMAHSFFPFGLGKHQCLGRRLAIKFVDGIVANLLNFDIRFENGVTPNLFKRKWYERLNSVSAAYNYPADPVYIELVGVKGDIKRVDSVMAKAKARMTMRKTTIISPIVLDDLTGDEDY